MSTPASPFKSVQFEERGYEPEPQREAIRGRISLAAFLTFAVAVTAYLIA